jgi:hypothetical protein
LVLTDILPFLSTACAHACLFIASTQPGLLLRLEDVWGFPRWYPMSSRRRCHQSTACGVPFWISAASCSLWWYIYETFGHVMVIMLSFTLWHCIWYSPSHYVCVIWSWRTCNLCIRFGCDSQTEEEKK